MGKTIGYVLSVIGVVLLALTLKPVKNNDIVRRILPFLDTIPNFSYILMGIAVVLLAVAVIMLKKSAGEKQPPEVPIYQGKNVVGFRRIGKKR